MFELLSSPEIWIGLFTLIILEIILGIDNLVFIAILSEKLPPHQRDKARVIGLSLALIMRLGLLSIISWIATLTTPLITVFGHPFSGRDLILLFGGIFLLFKATSELHERLEGQIHQATKTGAYASFGVVIAQIVVLDAVFSLDSVITAVGMVDQLGVMMAAVVISVGVMLLASKPLTRFVNQHQTVVVLCLSFLLMIGLSLIAEGFGFHLPKGYLYAAIGFSIMIEAFNQIARRNRVRHEARRPLRERTAAAVMRMMGDKSGANAFARAAESDDSANAAPFSQAESAMVGSVLSLADKHVRAIMTPRVDISWIDLDDDKAAILSQVLDSPHNMLPICQGSLDQVVGVARAKDILGDLIKGDTIDTEKTVKAPVYVYENTPIVRMIDTLKQSKGKLIFITDEFGSLRGICSAIDLLQAIAGEFPDEDEVLRIQPQGPAQWLIQGGAPLQDVAATIGYGYDDAEAHDISTLAGWLLHRIGRPAVIGEHLSIDGWRYDIVATQGNRITQIKVSRD